MTSEVPFYPLAPLIFLLAAVVFALRMARHLRVFAAARPSKVGDRPAQRLRSMAVFALAQVRMFREVRVGTMHAAIFWGFVILTVATANRVTGGLVEAILAWPLDGWLWRAVLAAGNLLALAVLLAIVYALFRRLVTRPARVTLSRDALAVLLLIAGIVAAELTAEAFRLARYGDPYAHAEVVSWPLGQWLAAPLAPSVQQVVFAVAWWINILLVSAFLVYLPGSKHLHVVTAVFNTAFRKLQPRGELPAMDLEADTGTFGVLTVVDLGWKDLLDAFTCTECGRCQSQCPAWATGKPLNPKTFIMGIRQMAIDAEAGVPLLPGLRQLPWNRPSAAGEGAPGAPAVPVPGPANAVRGASAQDGSASRGPLQAQALARPVVDAAIPYDAVWDCVTCGACVEACPVTIEHVDKIVGLRRNLVLEESRFPPEVTAVFNNLERHGNPWGQPRSARLDWARGLRFEVAVAADGQPFEVLYWVGCAAAFDDRNRRVARAVATCLHAAGIRFAVLGEEESCSGDPARRMGNEYLYQVLARANVETLNHYRPPLIVTSCPHCYNTLASEYSEFGGHYQVVHHSVYLAQLIDEGRLRTLPAPGPRPQDTGAPQLARTDPVPGTRPVTYHDSCYLARYNGVVEAPRAVLAAVPGLQLLEMEQHGKQSFCCGAGGGRMWMEERRGIRINAERTRQALETGADAVATACPFCLVMLRDGVADAAGGGDRGREVETLDIAELLAAALAPAPGAGISQEDATR